MINVEDHLIKKEIIGFPRAVADPEMPYPH